MNKFTAAVIQMDSQDNVEENLSTVEEFAAEAAARGAKLLAMPENVNYVGNESKENA